MDSSTPRASTVMRRSRLVRPAGRGAVPSVVGGGEERSTKMVSAAVSFRGTEPASPEPQPAPAMSRMLARITIPERLLPKVQYMKTTFLVVLLVLAIVAVILGDLLPNPG